MKREEYDSAIAAMELMLEGKPWVKTYAGGKPNYTEPQQEPACWYDKHGMVTHDPSEGITPLYKSPRPWTGLTDEQIEDVFFDRGHFITKADLKLFARAIEAKLKEKNTWAD